MESGAVVAERFEVERLAGAGGMATVYRALDRLTGGPVAVKVLTSAEAGGDRFAREARVLSELSHPAIVRYVAHGVTSTGRCYLAMEWLEGESLGERLLRAGLTAAESVALAIRVTEALGVAHRHGVIHRDVKPSNLFLPDGEVARVKVLDFGIARLTAATRVATRTGMMVGTPGYMSPEQARGDRDVDARADIFALGCVLFECLTGRAVFAGEHPMALLAKILLEEAPRVSSLRPDVPAALDDLVAKMIAKDPAARPQDAAALGAELAALGPIDDTLPAPLGQAPIALTRSENRLICVVLAGGDGSVAGSGTVSSQPGPRAPAGDSRPTMEIFGERGSKPSRPDAGGGEVDKAVLDALRLAVAAYGGRLEKLADGSVVLALSGTGAATDLAAQAARCALSMRELLPRSPMAIATGRAVLLEQWSLGEVIDRAAKVLRSSTGGFRRVALDQPRGVRLDETTAGLLDARFDVGGDASGLELRGQRDQTEVVRTLLGKPTPCVGRDRELSTLRAIFDECVNESVARVVLVTAAAGTGKSRLGHEFRRRIHESGKPVELWIGRGDPMRAGSPFGMIAPAVRRAASVLDGEPDEVRRRKLRARVARHVSSREAQRVVAFLGELVGVPFDDEDNAQLRAARRDPMLMGDQMRRAWEDWVTAETSVQPVLILLEDLHWGDLPTVKLLDGALRNLHDRPLMVAALARPEVLDLFPRLWEERDLQQIRLPELTRKAAEKLVRQVLGDDVGAATVERVVGLAEGNAFFLEELIRAVAEARADGSGGDGAGAMAASLAAGGQRTQTGGGVQHRALPETVLAMVQARLERLEPEARRVLRAGSIFGQVFWQDGLLALLGGGDVGVSELSDWLTVLVERELVGRRADRKFPGKEELVFRHALVREAAYAMLTEHDRQLGHRLAGEWLERAGERDAIVLAEHYERGEEPLRALEWYRRAAEQALKGNDLEAAILRCQRGVQCGADGPLLGALQLCEAEAHTWRGEYADTERCALGALETLPRGDPAWHRAAAQVAESTSRLDHHDRLRAIAAELRDINKGVPGEKTELSAAAAVATARTASQLLLTGNPALAEELLALCEPVRDHFPDDPAATGWIEDARAVRALFRGDLGAYLAIKESVVAQFERAGELRTECIQRVRLGYACLEIGAYPRSVVELRAALVSAARMGLHQVTALAKHNLGLALARQGHPDEGRALEMEAVEAFRKQGDRRLEHAARLYLAVILSMAGDLDGAELEARASVEIAIGASPIRAYALATLGQVKLARHQPAAALEASREAMALLEQLGGIDEGEALVRLVHAEALAAEGDLDGARAALAVAKRRLDERAGRITDPTLRDCFLTQVPENARTVSLIL